MERGQRKPSDRVGRGARVGGARPSVSVEDPRSGMGVERIEAVVLAAGRGTRLEPLTRDRPKPLLHVGGRPILEHCFERLATFRPARIRIVVGWKGDRVRERFGPSWRGISLAYLLQDEPLGLAHAVAVGAEGLERPFLVMHGDAVFTPRTDLSPVVRRFREGERERPGARPAASILTERRVPDEISAGAVRVDGSGRATDFAERPSAKERAWGRVAAGFYLLAPVAVEACRAIEPSPRGEYELADALRWLTGRGWTVLATDLDGERVNVNTPADLAAADRISRP